MAAITSTKDIPWFKLSNYDFLQDLSTESLEGQLLLHLEYLEWTKGRLCELGSLGGQLWDGLSENDSLSGVNPRMDKQWVKISKGNPNLNCSNTYDEYEWRNLLCYSDAIKGHNVASAKFNGILLGSEGLSPPVEDIHAGDVDLFLKSNFPSFPPPEKVTIEIDLKNHTDREIVTQLTSLLEEWRDQLDISEPSGITYKRTDHYQKLLNYQIIPLIDLKRWETSTGNTIEERIIINLLYPDNFKLGFTRTVMKFYNDIVSKSFREAIPKKQLKI
jgi:hypothetical protein